MSEQIGIDLPLCNECTKTLTGDLDEELAMMESQNASYMYCLDQLEQKEKISLSLPSILCLFFSCSSLLSIHFD